MYILGNISTTSSKIYGTSTCICTLAHTQKTQPKNWRGTVLLLGTWWRRGPRFMSISLGFDASYELYHVHFYSRPARDPCLSFCSFWYNTFFFVNLLWKYCVKVTRPPPHFCFENLWLFKFITTSSSSGCESQQFLYLKTHPFYWLESTYSFFIYINNVI